jgi:hypothetical protein
MVPSARRGWRLDADAAGADDVVHHGAQDAAADVVVAVQLAGLGAQGFGALLGELVGREAVAVELAGARGGGGVVFTQRLQGKTLLSAAQAGARAEGGDDAIDEGGNRGRLGGALGHGAAAV